MKKLMLLTGLLTIMPVMAHAEMCVDFDDDMNVIEYDCSKSIETVRREMAVEQAKIKRQKEEEYETHVARRANGIANVLADMKFYVRGAYGLLLSESSRDDEMTQKTDNGIYGSLGIRFNSRQKMFYDIELSGAYIPMTLSEQYVYSNTYPYTDWTNNTQHIRETIYKTNYSNDIKTYNFMLNAYVGYKIMPKLSIYGGAGVGYAYVTGTDNMSSMGFDIIDGVAGEPYNQYTYSCDSELDGGALVRLALGTEYDLGAGLSAFTEYTYMIQWIDAYASKTHNLLLGAKYSF